MGLAHRWQRVKAFVRSHDVHAPGQRSVVDSAIGLFLLAVLPAAVRASLLLAFAFAGCALLLLSISARSVLRPVWRAMPTAAGVLRAWYPVALVPLLYTLVPQLHHGIHDGRLFDHVVMHWDQLLFGGQPARELAPAAPALLVSEPLHAAYLSYYILVWAPALWFYLRERTDAFRDAMTAFVLASLVCFLFFVYFPVQGPRYLFPAPSSGSMESGPMYALAHTILEAGSSRGAAFPSGHVAVAIAQAIVVWRWAGSRAGAVVGLLAVLLAGGAVYGGFHYGMDAAAGAAVGVAAAAGGAARSPLRTRSQRMSPTTRASQGCSCCCTQRSSSRTNSTRS